MGISQKRPHSWCSGRLVLASPVSTVVEPLLLTNVLTGAHKTESSKLHHACVGTLVCAKEGHSDSTCATLSATFPHNLHRTSPSVEVCVFSFVGNNYSYSSYITAMIYVGHEAQPFIIIIIIIIIIVEL